MILLICYTIRDLLSILQKPRKSYRALRWLLWRPGYIATCTTGLCPWLINPMNSSNFSGEITRFTTHRTISFRGFSMSFHGKPPNSDRRWSWWWCWNTSQGRGSVFSLGGLMLTVENTTRCSFRIRPLAIWGPDSLLEIRGQLILMGGLHSLKLM